MGRYAKLNPDGTVGIVAPDEIAHFDQNVKDAEQVLDKMIQIIDEHHHGDDNRCTEQMCTPASILRTWHAMGEGHLTMLLRLAIQRLREQES